MPGCSAAQSARAKCSVRRLLDFAKGFDCAGVLALLFGRKGAAGHLSTKLLARRARLSQAQAAMNSLARSHDSGRALVAAFISAAFLWAFALSASPQLHTRVHHDANRAEHSCAVTLIATGSYEHAAQPPLVTGPQFTSCFCRIAVLSSTWVRPLFLCAHIFAHAPPPIA